MSLVGFKGNNHPQQTTKRGARDDVDDRGTDATFFASLEERFGKFTLDAAAAPHNAKCERFFTREDNGLEQEWSGRVWCNPPYSDLRSWVQKAWDEWVYTEPERIVMLLPANRVEQAWWQDMVEPFRDRAWSPLRVEFLRGRMRFDRPDWTPGPKGDRPPFGCCLLIWERPLVACITCDPCRCTEHGGNGSCCSDRRADAELRDRLDALDDATTERVLDRLLREAPDLYRRLLREASQIAPDAVNDALRAEGVMP